MPTFERTIDVLPFQGGTMLGLGKNQMMVRLTDSRMVWITGQTNPDFAFCSIIDVDGGITSANDPVVKTQMFQLSLASTTNHAVHASRLSDNTFLVMSQVVFSTNTTTTADAMPTYYWVFSIDEDDIISIIDSGTIRVFYRATNSSVASAFGPNHSAFVLANVSDNIVIANVTAYYSGVSWYYYKMTFNPDTNKLEYPNDTQAMPGSNFSSGQYPDRGNWNVSKVPGRPDLTLLSYRVGYSTELNGSISAVFDSNGDLYMSTAQLPPNTPVNSSPIGYAEMVPMAGDKLLISSNHDAKIYSIDYTAKTWTATNRQSFSKFEIDDNLGSYVFPLDANYWLIMSRYQFQTAGSASLRGKVVRIADENLLEQSVASSGNRNTGFGIPVTLTTWLNGHKETPELIDGKIFYWGNTNNPFGGSATRLSWTVIDLKNSI